MEREEVYKQAHLKYLLIKTDMSWNNNEFQYLWLKDALVLHLPKVFCTHQTPSRALQSMLLYQKNQISVVPCKLLPSVISNINLFQVIYHLEGKKSI